VPTFRFASATWRVKVAVGAGVASAAIGKRLVSAGLAMAWYVWMVMGLALLVGEIVLAGSFFLLFFGVGAILVGLIVAAVPGLDIAVQWGLFSVVSVILLLGFRKRLAVGGASGSDADSLVGVRGKASAAIPPGEIGQGEVRGSPWRVRNVGATIAAAGDEFVVKAVSGITLDIERVG